MRCRLREELGLTISPAKGQVLAGDPPSGKRLASKLGEWCLRYVREARDLGVDFVMQKRASWRVLRGRATRLGQNATRYMALRKAGARLGSVFRTGGLASILHGARARGVPTQQLARARALNGKALAGDFGGKS